MVCGSHEGLLPHIYNFTWYIYGLLLIFDPTTGLFYYTMGIYALYIYYVGYTIPLPLIYGIGYLRKPYLRRYNNNPFNLVNTVG